MKRWLGVAGGGHGELGRGFILQLCDLSVMLIYNEHACVVSMHVQRCGGCQGHRHFMPPCLVLHREVTTGYLGTTSKLDLEDEQVSWETEHHVFRDWL